MYFDQYIVNQSPADLDYGQFVVAQESRYSSLMPWHIDQVKNIILKETKNVTINTILDCNAHIGVDTILFRLLFPSSDMTAIELNPQTYSLLVQNCQNRNNIVGHEVKDIKVLNDDCLNHVHQDVDLIYFDPPWGQQYTQYDKINLYLSGVNVGDVINQVLRHHASLVVLKLPYNIDLTTLWTKITYQLPFLTNHLYRILTPSGKISYLLMFIK